MTETDDFDWSERGCPLTVLRKHPTPDEMGYVSQVEPCGAPLFVEYEEAKYLLAGGECDGCGPTWKVSCEVGHVLVLPDHLADDNYWEIPFDLTLVNEALSAAVCDPTQETR